MNRSQDVDYQTVALEPAWISWWQEKLASLPNLAFLDMPLRGICLLVDKDNKTATVVMIARPAVGGMCDILTRRVLSHLGYNYVYATDAICTTPEQALDRITLIHSKVKSCRVDADLIAKLAAFWSGIQGRF